MQQTSNVGENGIESIRVGGMKIDDLPIAEGAQAKQQLPDVIKTDKENRIEAIREKYPKQTVAWVLGAIRECEATIKNVRALKDSQQVMINDYSGYISLCDLRDRELEKTDDPVKIKELKLKYPPYNVPALHKQIELCKEAIERSDEVIDKEHQSISSLRELLVNCKRRDNELKELGA